MLTQAISQLVVLASRCLEQAMDRRAGSYEDMVGRALGMGGSGRNAQ